MKPRTLAIVGALALGLAAFILFYERDLPSSDDRRQSAKRVLTLDKSQVRELVIERRVAPAETIRLERTGVVATQEGETADPAGSPVEQSPWRLVEPLQGRADGWGVDRLIDSLLALDKQRQLEDADRGELGLDAPRAVLTLRGEFGERVVEVGAALPVGSTMAVAVRGEHSVAIVADGLFAEFAKPAVEWRAREVFVGDREAVRTLAFGLGDRRIALERSLDGYRVVAPFVDRADRDKVNALLSDLAALRAQSFVAPASASVEAAFADAAWLEVTSVPAVAGGVAPPPFRLELGAMVGAPGVPAAPAEPAPGEPGATPSPRRYARAEGLTMEVETALGELLAASPSAWRSPAWSAAEIYRVVGVELGGGGLPAVKLSRDGTEWKREVAGTAPAAAATHASPATLAMGGAARIAYGPVSDLLYALTGARASEVLERSVALARGANLAGVTRQWVLDWQDGGETLVLHPALASGEVPATSADRDTVLLLSASTVSDLLDKEAAVRSAEEVKPETADE